MLSGPRRHRSPSLASSGTRNPSPQELKRAARGCPSTYTGIMADPAVRDVEEGDVLTQYLASGKKKNKRYFWVSAADGVIMWDKKKSTRPNKIAQLISVEPAPAVRDARQWFTAIDADGLGELDSDELADLYRQATGEKLGKSRLKQAMHEMDGDGNGKINFYEFEVLKLMKSVLKMMNFH